jgi:hypothetical protein
LRERLCIRKTFNKSEIHGTRNKLRSFGVLEWHNVLLPLNVASRVLAINAPAIGLQELQFAIVGFHIIAKIVPL